jgi:hypothetical protein
VFKLLLLHFAQQTNLKQENRYRQASGTLTLAPMEVVEQDTTEKEGIVNLIEFLLPNGTLAPQHSLFGLSYNKRLLDGWVKQPSACCAAAAVAGAWNGLVGAHRRDAGSLNHADVLAVYRLIFLDMIAKKTAAFERKLGAPINSLYAELVRELFLRGREIGGKKGFGPTKQMVRKILDTLCRTHYKSAQRTTATRDESNAGSNGSDPVVSVSALDCLVVLLEKEGFAFEAPPQTDGVSSPAEAKAGEGKESDEVSECKLQAASHCASSPPHRFRLLTGKRVR